MEISYTIFDLLFYLLLYAFLGWCVEVFCAAVKNGRFVNRGFLNLPLNMPCGIAATLLLPVLGTMNHKTVLQYSMTLVIYVLVRCVTDQFVRGVSRRRFAAEPKGKTFFLNAAIAAAVMLLVYLVVHPAIMGLLYLMPKWLERTLVIAGVVLILADFVGVMRTLRTSSATRLNKAGRRLPSAWPTGSAVPSGGVCKRPTPVSPRRMYRGRSGMFSPGASALTSWCGCSL